MSTPRSAATHRPLPTADAGDLDWLMFRQDGVISRRQALHFMSAKVLWRTVAAKRWCAVHRGVYVTHNGSVTPHQYLWVGSLAAGYPALLGGLSALGVLGLQRFISQAVQVKRLVQGHCGHPLSDPRCTVSACRNCQIFVTSWG